MLHLEWASKRKASRRETLWRCVERKRKRVVSEASKWEEYFHRIRDVCPWSWAAWQKGLIDITHYDGIVKDLGDYEARVYILYRKPRLLKKIEKRLNQIRPDEEWLHSHPSFGPNATHIPVLIQQDQHKLNSIRAKIRDFALFD